MPTYTIQPTFSGGEFSPSLQSRVDVQKYSTGLKKLRNMIVHPHGGASNRPGLEFVCLASDSAKKVRLVEFEYSLDQSYILEFGNNVIRVIKDAGVVLGSDLNILEIVTPYNENDLDSLKFTQSVDVLYIFHPNFPPKLLTREAANVWVFSELSFINGPFTSTATKDVEMVFSPDVTSPTLQDLNLAIKGTIGTVLTSGPYFEAGHVGGLLKGNYYVQGSSISSTLVESGFSGEVLVKGTWRLATRGTWAGIVKIQRRQPGSYTIWETIRTIGHNTTDYNIDAFGTEDEITLMRIEIASFSHGTCYVDLSCDSFSHSGIVKITSITTTSQAQFEIVQPILQDIDLLSWQEGSWSELRGYPSCGIFYQDRLTVAATKYEPQTTWFSKTGNYNDFGTSSPLEDTDSISVNLPSRKMNGIRNLVSLSEVLAMTAASECSIGESGGVFSPTTVKTKVHGYRGSSSVDPVVVGNRAIMVQAMGGVVRDFAYDFASDGFTGSDLSIFSTHFFKNHTIIDMAYQQEPDSLIWVIRSDGKALSLTYMKEQDVVAWSLHETDGLFESVACIPGDTQNDTYFVVNRNGVRHVERLAKRLPVTDSEEAFFLDSGLTYRGVATTTISGLTHLNGKSVTALCNGRVVKNIHVSSGSITLPVASTVVHVGLPYVSDLQTLNLQVPMQDGTGYGRLVKVSEVNLSFLNTRGGYLGPDEDNLDEIIEVSSASLSDPKELFSGDYKQSMNSGYSSGGTVFYRQTDPLPVTILAIQPKITIGG